MDSCSALAQQKKPTDMFFMKWRYYSQIAYGDDKYVIKNNNNNNNYLTQNPEKDTLIFILYKSIVYLI